MAQVKARQICTVKEHPSHIGNLAGVQVLQARDGLKIRQTKEPIDGGRRAGTNKRRVKDHLGHIEIGAISVPVGIVVACVQVVGCARAGATIVVVVERECRVR